MIEVDNDLNFTQHFMLPHQQSNRNVDDVCAILVSIMAHGCFIGPYTMARLTQGVSYDKIHDITDWQLTEEAQRTALATIVNAITNLDISKKWGDGTTSSSDAQRYAYSRRTLQQTYSTTFRDFALEFYTFVADNYAPYFSSPIECTDRDSPYVMDGVLYNGEHVVLKDKTLLQEQEGVFLRLNENGHIILSIDKQEKEFILGSLRRKTSTSTSSASILPPDEEDPNKDEDSKKKTSKTRKYNLEDGQKLGEDEALDAAIDFLGEGYKDMGNGRFLSQDGLRQIRMGNSDILGHHGGGRHINFEILKPNPLRTEKFIIEENFHIFLE